MKTHHVLILSVGLGMLWADRLPAQTVQAGIFNPAGSTLSIKARPSEDVSGLFSGVNVTIRWLTSYGITLGSISSSYSIVAQGGVGTNGSYSYQDFGSTPNVTITWTGGSENELFTVAVQGGSGTGTFELTSEIGGGWYFELSSADITDYSTPFYQQSVNGTPLPIQLASFTAMPISQNAVRLDWSTVSETSNFGFEVQRSQANPNNYQTLSGSFIPGHGTTNEPHHYTYTDNTVSVGRWYYRLKQIDFDATFHYSDGVQVDVLTSVNEKPLPTVFALEQNYPNPFNPATVIDFALPRESHVRLEVYNVLGQKVATLVDETRQVGYYSERFDGRGFASGLYFYRLTTPEVSFLKKMMLVK
jgi:hypothetical protein